MFDVLCDGARITLDTRAEVVIIASESMRAISPDERPAARPAWRTALPFVIAVALIGLVLSRVDLDAFARAVAGVNKPLLAAASGAFCFSLWLADSFATVPLYRRLVGRIGYREFMTFRAASYLPSLMNHHLGQAALTWMLSRGCGLPLWRVAGATLVSYASWGGCLLGTGCLALVVSGESLGWLALPLGAGLAYLGLLALKPARLAKLTVLAPLFEAGVSGHLVALVTRMPHMTVMLLGSWASFELFGVHVPLAVGLRVFPVLMVALTIPLTPQGFGTRDAVAALLLAGYAPGETHAEKLAAVAAATTAWGVTTSAWEAVMGLSFSRVAARRVESASQEAVT